MNTNPASTMLHPLAALKESFVHSSCKYSCLPWLFPVLLWTSGLHSKRLTWHSYISKVNRLSTCWLNSLILKILRYSPPPKSLVGEGRWSRDAQYFLLVFNLKFVYPAGRLLLWILLETTFMTRHLHSVIPSVTWVHVDPPLVLLCQNSGLCSIQPCTNLVPSLHFLSYSVSN